MEERNTLSDNFSDNFVDATIADWKLRGFSEDDAMLGMSLVNNFLTIFIRFGPVIRTQIFIEAIRSSANILEIVKDRYAKN